MAEIKIENLSLIYGSAFTKRARVDPRSLVLSDLEFTIPDGKITVVLGPSGCGKTTLLRAIAGLLTPNAGHVYYDGVDINDVPAGERKIGMVFQNYALYPHFSTKRNILSYFFFKPKTPQIEKLCEEKLKRTAQLLDIGIEYLYDKKPNHLSMGERQRVALGRCITREPLLFLMDEPFSNLDQVLRQKYRSHLKSLLKEFNITTVFVTHDQHEALFLADNIAVMRNGKIEQAGTYESIYQNPASVFIAEFLTHNLDVPGINLMEGEDYKQKYAGRKIGVRPNNILLSSEKKENWLEAAILSVDDLPMSHDKMISLNVKDQPFTALVAAKAQGEWAEGPVWVDFEKIHCFDQESGLRIQA